MVFIHQIEEPFIDSLSDHLPSWNKFCIELVQNIFKVVSFDRLLRVEKLQKFLNELWSNVNFKLSYLDCFVDHKLQKEFVNSLQMRPSWIDFIFCLNTSLWDLKRVFPNIRQWSKYILFNHGHYIIQMRDDQSIHHFLILQQLLDFINSV